MMLLPFTETLNLP